MAKLSWKFDYKKFVSGKSAKKKKKTTKKSRRK